jgi:hypothetical protein
VAQSETHLAAKAAECGGDLESLANPSCSDMLLLALTPGKYSSNNTADTPGRRAFISPAQVGASGPVAVEVQPLVLLHCDLNGKCWDFVGVLQDSRGLAGTEGP